MKILIISQWFDPEPTFKGLAFARELARLGHQVEVLTGFPNYPGGELYPGYAVKFLQRETIDGISVIRVPLYPSHDASAFRRILNYLSFAVSASVLGPLLVKKADVAYVYHPPATVALPAIIIKALRGIPFVYDVQDLWPDTLAATGMISNRAALWLVGVWSKLTYLIADHLAVLSPGFKTKLIERGVPADKISVVYNWCDEAKLCNYDKDKTVVAASPTKREFSVLFAGTMGKAQGLDAVLRSAEILSNRVKDVRFVFIGSGIEVERLRDKARDAKIQNVTFHPRKPLSEMGPVLANAEVLLVHLKKDPLFSITVPSKIQAYMAAGRPILAGILGDGAELVRTSGAGLTCEPENPESIAQAVERLRAMSEEQRAEMGASGRKFYIEELSLRRGAKHFERIFQSL